MSLEQEFAEVVSVNADYAFLKTKNNNACGECASKSSCGSMKLLSPKASEKYNIRVENTLNLKQGDNVILELSASKLVQGTLLVYLLPLFSLFVFAGLGKTIGGEGMSAIAGVSGLLLALLFVKKFISHKAVSDQFVPRITRKML